MARVRTLLRRTGRGSNSTSPATGSTVNRLLRIGRISVDPGSHEVTVDGARIDCTRGEFAILNALADQPDRVFTRTQLLHHTRGIDRSSTERTIDVHMMNLRRKIEIDRSARPS